MKSSIMAVVRIVRQLYTILSAKQRKEAVIVGITMLLSSFLELISVSMIYPLLNLIIDSDSAREGKYTKWLFAVNPDISTEKVILAFGTIIIFMFLIKNIGALFFLYLQFRFSTQFYSSTSVLMLSSYMSRPYSYFVDHNSAEMLRGITADPSSVKTELLCVFQVMGDIISVGMLSVYLFVTSWEIALGALTLALICFLTIFLGFKGRIKSAGKTLRTASANMNKYGLQAIYGIKEITVSDRRSGFLRQYSAAAESMAKTSLIYNFIVSCPDRLLEGVCMSGFIGIVCIRVVLGVQVSTFIPILGAFAMGAFRILPSVSKISSRINTIIYYQPGLQHCYDNILEARQADSILEQYEYVSEQSSKKICFENVISIENVNWRYPRAVKNVLDNLSMDIYKGESIAIIGHSGAGKTTIVDVLLGLYRPQSGTIKIDGIDIFSIPHMWRKLVGYVPQSVYLVDDTIRANVAFGVETELVLDEKVWKSLEEAQMIDYVKGLPNGLDTVVGERGVRLSGGQRQRIAIARALYDNPDILILDEATSALDSDTENAVMGAIDALHKRKTLIIVTHRMTTIRNCDRFFEIVKGKAVERNQYEIFGDNES